MTDSPQVESVQAWPYQDSNGLLLPFDQSNPGQYGHGLIPALYAQMEKDGLLEVCLPGVTDLSLAGLFRVLDSKPIVVGLAKPGYDCAGIGWLYGVEGQEGARKAFMGFLFFRDHWGTPVVRSLARQALRYWFVDLKVDVLYGATLKTNRLARNFGKKLGFRELTDLPRWFSRNGEFQDGTLVMLAKEQFLAREVLRKCQPAESTPGL